MKFQIKNRWTGSVIFTSEIDADESAPRSIKLGLAVHIAVNEKAPLRDADLLGADLRDADLSDADLRGAALRDADLRGADLSGASLGGADLSGADLSDADLSDADLRGATLRGADLLGADLRDADLLGADLRGADLSGADLRGADLSGADLSDADLSGASLGAAPVIEDIHAKVYAAASQPGALDMDRWHCGTSHCRAGWVVTLAGKEGLDLEAKIGTPAAAMAIYMASDPERWKTERLPDFYCANNETALADMARMAGVSK